MAPGLRLFTDIAADAAPHLDAADGEELVRVDHAASVALGRRAPEPPGNLFVTTSEAEKGKGYAVDFLDITLHAVSRDLEAYPSPCIYTQAETAVVGKREKARLKELQKRKKQKIQEILDTQNAAIDADMMVLHNKYAEDKFAQEFGFQVCKDPVSVLARVLPPPLLKYPDSGWKKVCAPSVRQPNMINKCTPKEVDAAVL